MSGFLDRRVPEAPSSYRRVLGLFDLTNIGIAAIIGAGIFVFLGQEAIKTGPAVATSLMLAGVAACLAALSYAEAAAIVPGSSSAYGFAHAALGNLPAFMVGWLFVNGYAIGNAGVGSGWATFFVDGANQLGWTIPLSLRASPLEGGLVNLPSFLFFVIITGIALLGIQQSTRINNALVVLKLSIVALIIIVGAFLVRGANYEPFSPAGSAGIAGSTAILFFAYLGFDTIAAAGAEAKRPKRNLPIAILVSVGVCTLLYVLMAFAITGIAPSSGLDPVAPTVDAFRQAGVGWVAAAVTVGALIGLATVAFAFHIATARIFQAMARDGFLPSRLAKMSGGVPRTATLAVGAISATAAGFLPLDLLISSAVEANILIFMTVSLGMLVIKVERDGFQAPRIVHVAALVALASVLVFGIGDMRIHLASLAWIGLGLMIYGFWGHRSSVAAMRS